MVVSLEPIPQNPLGILRKPSVGEIQVLAQAPGVARDHEPEVGAPFEHETGEHPRRVEGVQREEQHHLLLRDVEVDSLRSANRFAELRGITGGPPRPGGAPRER